MAYSFCESIAAGPLARWHIRELPPGMPLRFGGGIQTGSLCGHPKAGAGWDLEVSITEHHLAHNTCPRCREVYRARSAPAQRQASAPVSGGGSYPPSTPEGPEA